MRPKNFDKVVGDIAARGEIFALVNNAGYIEPGAIEDISMADLRAQFETNLFGLVGLTKQVVPLLMQNGQGRIVNISSMASMVSLPLTAAYCAAKHALEAVSAALKIELWNTGIKVVNINRGVFERNIHTVTQSKTALLRNSKFANAYRKYLEKVPKVLPVSTVADAIFQAIGSPDPKQRYVIGSGRKTQASGSGRSFPIGCTRSRQAADVTNFNGSPIQ